MHLHPQIQNPNAFPVGETPNASAVPKDLGLGLNFRLYSEGYFLSGRP